MKTIECMDCGIEVEIKSWKDKDGRLCYANNTKRCNPCGAIHNLTRGRERIRKIRERDPYYCHQTESHSYDSFERKLKRVLDTLTWPKLPYIDTPLLDGLYENCNHN